MGSLINCKELADDILESAKLKCEDIKNKYDIVPNLAIITVGDDPASKVYVRNKIRACEKVGIEVNHYEFPETFMPTDLEQFVARLNFDHNVHGIIVQQPLPRTSLYKMFNASDKITNTIDPIKDVDGFSTYNIGGLITNNKYTLKAATPAGVMKIIKQEVDDLAGKRVVVIGRSKTVGLPLVNMLINEQATVTCCNSKTHDLSIYTKNADIVVSAVGKICFLTPSFFSDNTLIIDVGINRDDNGKLFGDVDPCVVDCFPNVKVTPVPGGVGPMTVAMLIKNVIDAVETVHHKND